MSEFTVVLPTILTILVGGLVAAYAIKRARPEDVPRVLEICGRMLRGYEPPADRADTVEASDGEEASDAGEETPPPAS